MKYVVMPESGLTNPRTMSDLSSIKKAICIYFDSFEEAQKHSLELSESNAIDYLILKIVARTVVVTSVMFTDLN